MEKQGKEEIFTLKKAKHCIGRTDWDYACAKQINPKIQYHFAMKHYVHDFMNQNGIMKNARKIRCFLASLIIQ